MKKMTKAEAGRKGAIIRWSRISKKKRSEIMRRVAYARYETCEVCEFRAANIGYPSKCPKHSKL
ncbi:hypothetical protein [Nitrobacter hamburgensis]|nr:hypothetical protein [Nitrobacter hamburgensis]